MNSSLQISCAKALKNQQSTLISIQKYIKSLANKFQSISDVFLPDGIDYSKKFAIHNVCNNLY